MNSMLDNDRPDATATSFIQNSILVLCLLAPSLWMIATIPPLWRDVDAYLQLTQDPRVATFWGHAPAYCYLAKVPLLIAGHLQDLHEFPLPLTDRGVWLLIITQHLGLAAAVFYFIRAVSCLFWVRLVLAMAWASNPFSYTFAHCVGSETLSMILVIVLALKALRLVQSQDEPRWTDWYLFAIVLCLCILSRHLNLFLAALLPATFLLAWIADWLSRPKKAVSLKLRGRYLRQAIVALLIGLACIGVAGSLTRGLARKTKLHPHSRLGYTFLWRLRFLNSLPRNQRNALLERVTARTKKTETRKLIGLVQQIEQEGTDLNATTFMQRAAPLLYPGMNNIPWEQFDQALNDMAFAFLLPPTTAHMVAAQKDFRDAIATPATDPAVFLFPSTSYYFLHPDEMPGCAKLVTFRDSNAEQINLIPTQHIYFRLWMGLPFYAVLAVWAMALLTLAIVASRRKRNIRARIMFAVALTGVGLLIVAATCLLDEYSPRFGLPMWELLLLSLMLLAATAADLVSVPRQSPPGSCGPEP
jgi:hypothetical protein